MGSAAVVVVIIIIIVVLLLLFTCMGSSSSNSGGLLGTRGGQGNGGANGNRVRGRHGDKPANMTLVKSVDSSSEPSTKIKTVCDDSHSTSSSS